MTGAGSACRIKDQGGRGVVRADVELADDPGGVHIRGRKGGSHRWNSVSRAASRHRIRLPGGCAHRPGAVVSWQWRSDVVPRLQPVVPGTVVFDSSSEEGRMFLTWGFTPKVLGYIPKRARSDHAALARNRAVRHRPRHVAASERARSCCVRPSPESRVAWSDSCRCCGSLRRRSHLVFTRWSRLRTSKSAQVARQ